MAGPVDDLIAEGREAFRHGDGAASRRAFEAALAVREDAVVLEGLGRALYLEVDYPASMEASMLAGTVPVPEFFSPANAEAILAAA